MSEQGSTLAQLLRTSPVKVVSSEGEVQVTITLELNINLNSEGITVGARPSVEASPEEALVAKKEDKTLWEIPDFVPIPKVNFGKKE